MTYEGCVGPVELNRVAGDGLPGESRGELVRWIPHRTLDLCTIWLLALCNMNEQGTHSPTFPINNDATCCQAMGSRPNWAQQLQAPETQLAWLPCNCHWHKRYFPLRLLRILKVCVLFANYENHAGDENVSARHHDSSWLSIHQVQVHTACRSLIVRQTVCATTSTSSLRMCSCFMTMPLCIGLVCPSKRTLMWRMHTMYRKN